MLQKAWASSQVWEQRGRKNIIINYFLITCRSNATYLSFYELRLPMNKTEVEVDRFCSIITYDFLQQLEPSRRRRRGYFSKVFYIKYLTCSCFPILYSYFQEQLFRGMNITSGIAILQKAVLWDSWQILTQQRTVDRLHQSLHLYRLQPSRVLKWMSLNAQEIVITASNVKAWSSWA
jgi:hypothetical protein